MTEVRRRVVRTGAVQEEPVAVTKSQSVEADSFEVRDGDLLVVSYPEVNVGLGGNSFSSVKLGGLIYTRRLLAEDDVDEQYRRIYAFLKAKADADGRAKIAAYQDEVKRIRSGS